MAKSKRVGNKKSKVAKRRYGGKRSNKMMRRKGKKSMRRRVMKMLGMQKGGADEYNILIIDAQKDFHEGGGLAINGATADSQRILGVLQAKNDAFEKIVLSLDTHTPNHIGHPGYWTCVQDNTEPKAYTLFEIKDDKIMGSDGKEYTPKITALLDWTKKYIGKVASYGKGSPLIWPTHCLENTDGHEIVELLKTHLDSLDENKVKYFMKGQNNASEMYSIFKAEMPVPKDIMDMGISVLYSGGFAIDQSPSDGLIKTKKSDRVDGYYLNTGFNTKLWFELKDKPLVICGQAMSHCVNWSLRDYVEKWLSTNILKTLPDGQVTLLIDGATTIPGFENNSLELINFCNEKNVRLQTCQDFISGNVETSENVRVIINEITQKVEEQEAEKLRKANEGEGIFSVQSTASTEQNESMGV